MNARSMRELESIERASDAELRKMGVDTAAKAVGRAAQDCGEHDDLDDRERSILSRALSTLDRIESLAPSHESEAPGLIRIMVLGKLGEFDKAVAEANKAHQARPTWSTAITVANALRRTGNLDGAIEMWTVAAELDPSDVAALLELGDAHLRAEEWEAAIRAYERALEREAEQPWAIPSLHYCRYRATGERKWLERVKRLANKAPDECGVENILAQLTGSTPSDVGIERAQQLLEIDRA